MLARFWHDAWQFANRRAHLCAILLAISMGTVGSTLIVGLNVTVGLGGGYFHVLRPDMAAGIGKRNNWMKDSGLFKKNQHYSHRGS